MIQESRDLDLIGGVFLENNLETKELYLLKYFKSKASKAFFLYYKHFGSGLRFTDHTGHLLTKRHKIYLKKRLHKLEELMQFARDSGDFELVAQLESGKYKLKFQ